jgi:hypothetical protein
MEYRRMVEFSKNVPIPPPTSRGKDIYEIKNMAIGDSFEGGSAAKQAISGYKMRHPTFAYTTRRIENGLWRIWRTA